jgi:hypothetical protein
MPINTCEYRAWRTLLDALEAEHARDGSRLEVCESLWNTLEGGVGNNLKSIPRTGMTFRQVALRSQQGAELHALQEGFEVRGQLPSRADFDDELYWAMMRTRRDTRVESVRWLLATLGVSD